MHAEYLTAEPPTDDEHDEPSCYDRGDDLHRRTGVGMPTNRTAEALERGRTPRRTSDSGLIKSFPLRSIFTAGSTSDSGRSRSFSAMGSVFWMPCTELANEVAIAKIFSAFYS
jgi:hypothetical protein